MEISKGLAVSASTLWNAAAQTQPGGMSFHSFDSASLDVGLLGQRVNACVILLNIAKLPPRRCAILHFYPK